MNNTVTFNTYKTEAKLAQHKEFYGIINVEDFNTYECKRKFYQRTMTEYLNKNEGGKQNV